MKNQNKRPFCSAEIEIVALYDNDIIVTSPTGNPFPGEEEVFPTSWRDINEE